MLFNNSAFKEAADNNSMSMIKICRPGTELNSFCHNVNTTNGTITYANITVNWFAPEVADLSNTYKRECKAAGGTLVEEWFDIVFKLSESVIAGLSVNGNPNCVGSTTCKNDSDVVSFIKSAWVWRFNASLYDFTLHKIKWDNSTY